MRTAGKLALGLAMVLGLLVMAQAAEDKADDVKTLKGIITCGKCGLRTPGLTKCANVIKVKEGDKDVVYWFKDKGGKEPYHKQICTDEKPGSVTGKISEKGGKKYITPEKDGVKFD
jgi:hypothetical protein